MKWNKKLLKQRAFWLLFSLIGVVFFSKIKFHRIFGTPFQFSLLTIFGPNVEVFGGFTVSLIVFTLGRIIQILLGFSKGSSALLYIVYFPLFFASHYFSKLVDARHSSRPKYPLLIPLVAILLFILHPIGRVVWYFSLFWAIPIVIYYLAPKIDQLGLGVPRIFIFALAATYIDHAIGSIIFLYTLNIPAEYWVMAIPYVPLERTVFALGITAMYFFLKETINALSPTIAINIYNINVIERREQESEISLDAYNYQDAR